MTKDNRYNLDWFIHDSPFLIFRTLASIQDLEISYDPCHHSWHYLRPGLTHVLISSRAVKELEKRKLLMKPCKDLTRAEFEIQCALGLVKATKVRSAKQFSASETAGILDLLQKLDDTTEDKT